MSSLETYQRVLAKAPIHLQVESQYCDASPTYRAGLTNFTKGIGRQSAHHPT